jgi:predicted NUDIX family NTP pyrophosphohydrolase
LSVGRGKCGALGSTTRGVWGGGEIDSTGAKQDVMDYITIASTGNASDFGDLASALERVVGMSNGHGGL